MKDAIRERGQVGIGTLIVFIALVLVAAIAAGVLINTAGFLQTQAEDTGEDSTSQVADNVNVIGETGSVIAAPTDNGDENFVYEARLTVQRAPGSDNINLEELAIQWVGDNGFEQIVHVGDSSVDAPEFETDEDQIQDDPGDVVASDDDRGDAAYLIDEITAESTGDAVMTDDGDRYDIVIPVGVMVDEAESTALVDEDLDDTADEDDADPDVSDLEFTDIVEDEAFDNAELGLLDESQEAELEITTSNGAVRNVVLLAPDTLIGEEGGTVTL